MAIKDDMEDVQEAVINELITENGITNTLADDQVTESKILNNAVTTNKIANGNVTPTKLSQPNPLNWGDGNLTISKGTINNAGLEINYGLGATETGLAYVDFHSNGATLPDFDARIVHSNGQLEFWNLGGWNNTPNLIVNTGGGVTLRDLTIDNGLADGGQMRLSSYGYNNMYLDNLNGNLRIINEETATALCTIDNSGNLLVGKTTTSFNTAGSRLTPDGGGQFVVSGGGCVEMNRLSSDGTIALFQKDGSTVGSWGNRTSTESYIDLGSAGLTGSSTSGGALLPTSGGTSYTDNSVDLGFSNGRFDDIYATNGTIQTSDANDKQDIEALSEAEQRVAVACKGLLRKFRWKSAVEEKGEEARIHFGIIAQDLKTAFEAEGLDAGRYAMFISSTWWEKERVVPAVAEETDEEGNITTEAQESYTTVDTWQTEEEADEGSTSKTRLGVRYSELLAFIISAI